MKRLHALIVSIAMCWAVGASAQQASWHRQFTADRSVSVEFPGKTLDRSRDGQEFYLVLGSNAAESFLFQLQVFPLPDRADVSKAKAFLEWVLTEEKGTKYGPRVWKTVNGLDAVEATGVTDEGEHRRTLALLKGRQLIVLVYSGPADFAKGPLVDRFISSLRFEK